MTAGCSTSIVPVNGRTPAICLSCTERAELLPNALAGDGELVAHVLIAQVGGRRVIH